MRKVLKYISKFFLGLLAFLFIVLAILVFTINTKKVNAFFCEKASSILTEKTGKEVYIKRFYLLQDHTLEVDTIFAESGSGDTLAMIPHLEFEMNLHALLYSSFNPEYLRINNATVKIVRDSNEVFNFQYFIDAFASDNTDTTSSGMGVDLSGAIVSLNNSYVLYQDKSTDMRTENHIGTISIAAARIDLDRLFFGVEKFGISETKSDFQLEDLYMDGNLEDIEAENVRIDVDHNSYTGNAFRFNIPFFKLNLDTAEYQIDSLYLLAQESGYDDGDLLAKAQIAPLKWREYATDTIRLDTYWKKDESIDLNELLVAKGENKVEAKGLVAFLSDSMFFENPLQAEKIELQLQANVEPQFVMEMGDFQNEYLQKIHSLQAGLKLQSEKGKHQIDSLNLWVNHSANLKLNGKIKAEDYNWENYFLQLNNLSFSAKKKDLRIFLEENVPLPSDVGLTLSEVEGYPMDFATQFSVKADSTILLGEVDFNKDSVLLDAKSKRLTLKWLLGDTTAFSVAQIKLKGKAYKPLAPDSLKLNAKAELYDVVYDKYSLDTLVTKVNGALDNLDAYIFSKGKGIDLSGDVHYEQTDSTSMHVGADLNINEFDSHACMQQNDTLLLSGTFSAILTKDSDSLRGAFDINELFVCYNGNGQDIKSTTVFLNLFPQSSDVIVGGEYISAHLKASLPYDSILTYGQNVYNKIWHSDTVDVAGDSISFKLKFKQINSLAASFSDAIDSLELDSFYVAYQGDPDSLTVSLSMPYFKSSSIQVFKAEVKASSTDSLVLYNFNIADIFIGDSLKTSKLALEGRIGKEMASLDFKNTDKDNEVRYNIGGQYLENRIRLNDLFLLNYIEWKAIQENANKRIVLAHEKEKIIFDTDTALSMAFEEAKSHHVFPVDTPSSTIGGDLGYNFDKRKYWVDLNFSENTFMSAAAGDFYVKAVGELGEKHFAEVKYKNKKSLLRAYIEMFYQEDTITSYNGRVLLDHFYPSDFEVMYEDYAKNVEGFISGDVKIKNNEELLPNATGYLQFNKIEVFIPQISNKFLIPTGKIEVKDEKLTFNQLEVTDTLGNPAKLNGYVLLDTDVKEAFDLKLTMDDFYAINSTRESPLDYYGKLLVSSKILLTGNYEIPKLDVEFNVLEGTDLYYRVPQNVVSVNSGYDNVVQFVDFSDTTEVEEQKVDTSKVTFYGVDLKSKVKIYDKTKLNVLIDPISGDRLDIEGGGKLNIRALPNQAPRMNGKLVINKGQYKMTFYGIASRRLSLSQGSDLTWSGDIENPRLNLEAQYEVNTSPYPLVSGEVEGTGSEMLYKESKDFLLKIFFRGTLESPKMSFEIVYTDDDNSPKMLVEQKLREINSRTELMNQQVFSLLLFNSFSSPDSRTNTGGGVNPFSNLSQMLSSQLNKMSKKYIKDVDINWDIGTGKKTNAIGEEYQQSNVGVSVKKQLFSDRITLEVGGGVEYTSDNSQGESGSDYVRNASVDISLTEDGRFRLQFYTKNDRSYLGEKIIDNGVSLIYGKDYETINQLFKPIDSRTKEENQEEKDVEEEIREEEKEEKEGQTK